MQKNHDKLNGIILSLCAISAIVVCNSPLYNYYADLLNTIMSIKIGSYQLAKPLILWVNEGLMALFFLAVTLEIKHEMIFGSLSSSSKRLFPFWGALGGMLFPALIYFYITASTPEVFDGWAIPTATDIVFALSLLGICYDNCPTSVRSFLLALAVFDDIGAILIIALYYSNNISLLSITLILSLSAVLYMLNRYKVALVSLYVFVGACVWLVVLKSGVHATLAGIFVGMALPYESTNGEKPLAERAQDGLYPWVNYFILPVFAFTNAGVSFSGITMDHLFHVMPIAIILGLVLGKQIGITLFSYLSVKLKLAEVPGKMSWHDIYGVSILCGVGFTMSLFIGTLAFEDNIGYFSVWVRLGVLLGSAISAILGIIYFKILYGNTSSNN
jgi:NhaA family Na+:H+ antiporter